MVRHLQSNPHDLHRATTHPHHALVFKRVADVWAERSIPTEGELFVSPEWATFGLFFPLIEYLFTLSGVGGR